MCQYFSLLKAFLIWHSSFFGKSKVSFQFCHMYLIPDLDGGGGVHDPITNDYNLKISSMCLSCSPGIANCNSNVPFDSLSPNVSI